MWDGNPKACVMTQPKATQVEREPMWDGNGYSTENPLGCWRVEREPMWDGNSITSNPCTTIFCVEREPMWDGN